MLLTLEEGGTARGGRVSPLAGRPSGDIWPGHSNPQLSPGGQVTASQVLCEHRPATDPSGDRRVSLILAAPVAVLLEKENQSMCGATKSAHTSVWENQADFVEAKGI